MKQKCELGLKCPHQNQRQHISEFYHGDVETFNPQRRCTVCRDFGHNIARCTDPRAEQERKRRAELRKRSKKNALPPPPPTVVPSPEVIKPSYTEERIEQDRVYEKFLEEDRIKQEELEIQEAIRISEELTQREKMLRDSQLIGNYKKRTKTNNFSYTFQFRCPSEVLVYNFSPQETWKDAFNLLISHKSVKSDTESEEWIVCDPLYPGNPIILANGTEISTIEDGTFSNFFQNIKSVRASFVVSVQ